MEWGRVHLASGGITASSLAEGRSKVEGGGEHSVCRHETRVGGGGFHEVFMMKTNTAVQRIRFSHPFTMSV